MGVLVSLCDYRESLRKEEEARTQILVRAWANALGDPEVKPYYLPLEEHLTEST